ncbi:NAD(P)/FAD-dependent oxidoreductase [Pseudoalteromonas phenolica]|uniref:NADH dehydrogenase n=1 Tax=Pseudoalteromonas phenolica TaxID=161398 RepID=A0A0S2JYQ0_9GAMM|nr:NAD(P)/FAD-dependent oxidoreductase [Pseudoalteromonas phenolica]ALO41303.1 NADH dehydrogenase [Pseudoalteromonas phenolica]MBE0354157.1 NADH dehydrogenase [Pseudoalteromonas phenolica O-BC30]RXE95510.1 NAD(P)/FAD-dependent oxidoreductase [Pseudoalteromonas phenolica O-BC30]
MINTHPNIVIIGGGAGGLELASKLGNKLGKSRRANITLIDKNRTHIWKPLLHEVATGSLDTSLDGVVYSAHAARHGFQFILGEFINLDAEKQAIYLKEQYDSDGELILPQRTVHYDELIIAIGSVSNDFNTPGVSKHCYFLDSHQQAERFQHALLNCFTRVHQAASQLPEEQNRLSIAIVGGGATGVELSAELVHVAQLLKHYGMSAFTSTKLTIHLIEAGPTILPALPTRISNSARDELRHLGVNILEGTKVSKATSEGFITDDNTLIQADLMLWAAGVKVADFIKNLDCFEFTRNNQIKVDEYLQAKGTSHIHVLGDACACEQEDGTFVPPRAQAAHQMASNVAHNILAKFTGKAPKPFVYKDHGSLVNLSRFSAVGSLMGNLTNNTMFIEGNLARVMYLSLYRMHQNAIHGPIKTTALWLSEKLLRSVRPKMKLH